MEVILALKVNPTIMAPLSQLKNLRPDRCNRLFIKNGWQSIHREGTHETFTKMGADGKLMITQLIWSGKNCHPSNVKNMIEKTDIPAAVWIKECK